MAFAIGYAAGIVTVLLVVVISSLMDEKCPHCKSRATSRQHLTASSKKYLVCHGCGWEELDAPNS